MLDKGSPLPDDIAGLHAIVAGQRLQLETECALRARAEAALDAAKAELDAHALLIGKLKIQIARLKRLSFGQSSERLRGEIAQLELALEEMETAEAALPPRAAPPASARKIADRAFAPNLPREEIVLLPSGGDCTCPQCGGKLRRLGQDESEMLDIAPVVVKVVRHVRPKFSCRSCEAIVQAPAPGKAVARGRASFRLISHILVQKFDHHLPLYRQAEMLAQQGVEIDRSTLAGWAGQGAALLDAVVTRIKETVLSSPKLHTDDTPVPMLDPGAGKTRQARLWVHAVDDRAHAGPAPPAVWFAFTLDRKGEHPQRILKDFKGFLQADAYAGYEELYRRGAIVEVACWAHARRKIFDLHDAAPTETTTGLMEQIRQLYALEGEIRGQPPDVRLAKRQAEGKPLLDRLKTSMEAARSKLSSKSELARALAYALARWPALVRHLDDGRLEIDNLVAERALRGIAIGRRNWLFAGSKAGGERAAAIYSIIETCKLNGVEPYAYIADVMQKIAEGWPNARLDELMPWAWKQAKEATAVPQIKAA